MFISHFAIGFGAKAIKPKISLGILFLSAQFLDLLWPTFLLLGIETVKIDPHASRVTPLDFVSYPISHSLIMATGWAILLGLIYWSYKKNVGESIVVALCVVSHWLLDFIVHIPDLPLYPGTSPKVGLGLWNSIIGTQLAEGLIFTAGIFLYLRVTRASNKTGTYSLWSLVLFLLVIHISNLFGPPPPGVTMIAWVGQAQWLIVLWGFWIDRNREATHQ